VTTDLLQPTGFQSADARSAASEQFLSCQLVSNLTVLLPMRQLSEVLTIGISQMTAIPQMASWVVGVYNWRGEVLWVIDLAHMMGFTPWYQQSDRLSNHNVAIVNRGTVKGRERFRSGAIGLAVNQVNGLEWCDPATMHPPSAATATPEMAPFVRGYWLSQSGEMITYLDADYILSIMSKN
jgi:positive phototaxis protein PixI